MPKRSIISENDNAPLYLLGDCGIVMYVKVFLLSTLFINNLLV